MPLLEEVGTVPSEKYARGHEILEHCRKIGQKFRLYDIALFQTVVQSIRWEEESGRWVIKTSRGDVIKARHVMASSGPLNRPKLPGIPGIRNFKGRAFHTSRWDYGFTGGNYAGGLTGLADKKVALIGTGATGIQVLPYLAQSAEHVSPDVRLAVYRPSDLTGDIPVILQIHGGGFVAGQVDALQGRHRELAAALKCCLISVDYRLAPETRFPGAIEDCYAALGWVTRHSEALAISAGTIVLMGESAGGGLAAALAPLRIDPDIYINQDRFEAERQKVFRETPLLACLSTDIEGSGDFITHDDTGVPIVVVRGRDMKVRAFLNVCPHRGARLVRTEEGRASRFTCWFHGWTFLNDGKLLAAPSPKSFGDELSDCNHLTELPAAERNGFVFVVATPGAPLDIDAHLGDFAEQLDFLEVQGLVPVKAE